MHNAGQTQSLCAGPAKSWVHFMSHALNLPGYCLAVMQSDLVGYSVVGFGYNLVSCTLSGLSHESGSRTGIRPMTKWDICTNNTNYGTWKGTINFWQYIEGGLLMNFLCWFS